MRVREARWSGVSDLLTFPKRKLTRDRDNRGKRQGAQIDVVQGSEAFVIDQPAQAYESADAKTIVDALWSNWPIVVTLRAADVGMGSAERINDFIRNFQDLSDAGLISYEAFVVGPGGPQVVDAALTARGRAVLARRMNSPMAPHQLAS
jgi:hypothetical protein